MVQSRGKRFRFAAMLCVLAAPLSAPMAQPNPAPPDFSSHFMGWVGLNGGGPSYESVEGQLAPVVRESNRAFASPIFPIPI